MNLRQAAQQALEALEYNDVSKQCLAITALRAALAEPEQPHDFLCICGAEWDIYPDGREELVATPDSANRSTDSAEPFCNQEPVAEIVQAFADLKAVEFGGEMPPVGTKLYTAPTPRKPQTTHWEGCEAVHPECRKPEQEPDGISWLKRDSGYFTAPIPRKPLTDEEIIKHFEAEVDTGLLSSFADGVRFAERAHGIGEQT